VVDDRELASELTDDVQPFTMIQNAFLDDAALSAVAFRVFIILKSYTSGRAKTKLAFPSYSTLKARCNISGNTTLAKAIRELESAGWIKRDKRFGRSSLYTLRAITPKTGIVAITPEIGAQSAKNWPNSPPKTGMYQEVPKQEVAKQEVDPATAAARAAGIGSQPSQRIALNKTNRLAAASRMDELERHPAIAAHRRVCGIQPMTLEQAEMIVSRVNGTAETTWPVDLVAWVQGTRKDGQPFNLAAIERQLQWHTDAETRRKVRSPAASAPTLSESEYAELTAKMEAPL